jgi:MFS family permease
MVEVLKHSWALLLGLLLLLIGNGLQGTLLGIRGAIEGYDATTMSWVMSAYFAGFLLGSWRAPQLIRNVGHVRVFAALASMISAAFILYALTPTPYAWVVMRFIVGFCFSGVYVVAESWLNEASSNENRGKALSLYVVVQMLGMITAQGIVNFGDPSGYDLFVVMSVLVSISFLPILLTVHPAPSFQTTKAMTLLELYHISPLGCVGTFLLGGVFAALLGMAAVFGTEQGLSVSQISAFIAAIYVGGLVLQIPIGALSDKIDRRVLIVAITATGALASLVALPFAGQYSVILALGFILGGVANPLYALLIAYTNDYLQPDDMAAASGGMLFLNGLGATAGPLLIGAMMRQFGASAFFLYCALLLAAIALFAVYRMTRRATPRLEEASPYTPMTMQPSAVALGVAQEIAIESAETHEAAAAGADAPQPGGS